MSFTNPFDPFRFFAPLSGAVTQDIRPALFSTVNNFAGDARIEGRVVSDVASYGKQLGLLTEVVLELARDARLRAPARESARRLGDIAAAVERLKQELAAPPLEEAEKALDRLQKADAKAYRALIEGRAGRKTGA